MTNPLMMLNETGQAVGPDCKPDEQKTEDRARVEPFRDGYHERRGSEKHHRFLQSEFFHKSSGPVSAGQHYAPAAGAPQERPVVLGILMPALPGLT